MAVAPLLWGFGFPPVIALYLATVFVLIPFELGYPIYQARKKGTSLGNVVLYRLPVPKGQFVTACLFYLLTSRIESPTVRVSGNRS